MPAVLQPAYEEVCSGRTGHTEAVLVFYDAKEVHYKQLLDVFFGRIDPTQVSILVNGYPNDFNGLATAK
jgi:peptide-methionine (S)-S-oxide reductase